VVPGFEIASLLNAAKVLFMAINKLVVMIVCVNCINCIDYQELVW